MARVISDPEIPDDTGVSIECQIPQTNKRIDFILSGSDTSLQEHVIIIELKQWKICRDNREGWHSKNSSRKRLS